ncbi:TetR/AcrR family transcriptional regulator [Streptomyces sp. NPDC059828]|uniref:TetR/AcrR family transcriptional regulator n=1 Tax=Streptomyces sp. NPDC059828 TaxID=3346965 RepID=UPI003669AD4E
MAATARTLDDHRPVLGLRERKKLKTRAAIRGAAYRLIAEQGYEATTTEQIAAAAEVSLSTLFRYFPAKEDIVLAADDASGASVPSALESALRARPADEPPLESLRSAVTHTARAALGNDPGELRLRTRLLVQVPAVRARLTESMTATALPLSRVLAERTGRQPDDLELRVCTAAVLSTLREVTLYWAEHDQRDDLVVLLDRALDTLKEGLPL